MMSSLSFSCNISHNLLRTGEDRGARAFADDFGRERGGAENGEADYLHPEITGISSTRARPDNPHKKISPEKGYGLVVSRRCRYRDPGLFWGCVHGSPLFCLGWR